MNERVTIDIENRPRSPFRGTLVSYGPGPRFRRKKEERVEGCWATYRDTKKKRILGFHLKGIKNSGEPFEWSIPINQTMGDGYYGKGADGSTYYSTNIDPTGDKL